MSAGEAVNPPRERWFLKLYPRAWRERYGEEFVALVEGRNDWRTAMDVVKAAVTERLRPSGAANVSGVGRGLAMACVAYLVLLVVFAAIQVALLVDGFGFAIAAKETFRIVSHAGRGVWVVWMALALASALIGILANRLGWNHSRPRLARNGTRFGVFFVMVAVEIATAPPITRIAPYSAQQLVSLDLATLLTGFIVSRAMFGPRSRGVSRA